MEKIRSLVGMVSKKKFFSACKCYENNKYGVDYVKPQLCIDEESHLIFCDRCGAVIDPFAAMLMVAIFEERQNREWGRYMESARRFWKIAHSYKPYRVALKEMEKNIAVDFMKVNLTAINAPMRLLMICRRKKNVIEGIG